MNIIGNYKIYSEERTGLKKKPVTVWVAENINDATDTHWLVTRSLLEAGAQRATTNSTRLITW